jgi:F-type H+-transporting ATPase subunit epsilon
MADGVFTLEVVTPEEKLLETRARSVTLRSSDGDLTVLDGHTPLVTDIVPGEVKVEQEDGEIARLAFHGGFLQVGRTSDAEDAGDQGDQGVAEPAERIDVARAEQARAAAAARVEELSAAAGRGPGGGGAAPSGGGGAGGETTDHVLTPEELELERAEAALRRAEVRLEVAGATVP